MGIINPDYPDELLERLFSNPGSCGLIADRCEHCYARANVINGKSWLCGFCGYINQAQYAEGKRKIFSNPNLGPPFSRIKLAIQQGEKLELYIEVD